ncbi:MAG: carbohydrate ABC transporter permease, partial [Clostridia bacterium]|nr:carbohydrate ABC transporter permease [Clostridia bacterium]
MKPTKARIAFNIFNYTFLVLIACAMFYPMWYVICASFSNSTALTKYAGILLWPQEFSLAAYKMMLRNPMIMQGFINTIIIVVSATVLNVIFTSICAYVLSRKQVLWNKL